MFGPMDADNFKRWIIAQQASREWQERDAVPKLPIPPVITISRQLGTDSAEIAKQLGLHFGWNVWEREIVDKIAADAHIHRQVVELLDEHSVSELEEMFRALFSATSMMTSQTYARHLIGTIFSIGRRGKAIIVGRGANFILPKALNVRLVASLDYRIQRLMSRDRASRKETERRLTRSDRDRADFVKQMFRADIDDATRYDLVLRMDGFSLQEGVQMIQTATKIKFRDWQEK